MLKKNKLTSTDLINYIEKQWAKAGEEKYQIHMGDIIMGRMVNEYIKLQDVENVKRWLSMMNRHELSKSHPDYINNYYAGCALLACNAPKEALHYLKLCYEENPEYIFTRREDCIEFFCREMKLPINRQGKPSEKAKEIAKEKEPYSGSITLPVWTAFFGEDAESLHYDIGGDMQKSRLSKNHKAGLKYLEDNQQAVLNAILEELFLQYPRLQVEYGYEEEDKNDFMPDITKPEDFAELLSPISIHVLSVYKDKFPYIGYEFFCSWDNEHGLGVMMYQDRVVKIGGAEDSFLSWVARGDLKNHLKS